MVYQNIKRIAEEKKVKISEIERACGITPKYIGAWDRVMPNALILSKVAKYLDTTVEELLKE